MTSRIQSVYVMLVMVLYLGSIPTMAGASEKWDFFVYAQSWPPAVCIAGLLEHHTCHVPQEVKTWTIHGLWPSTVGSKSPENCNTSLPFDFSKVAELTENLTTFWPNLYNDTKLDSFWSHEWEKHGTCALDLPATSGELNFFKKGLELNQKYNISRMLSAGGVTPSTTALYSFSDFMNAIKSETGYAPVIECAARKYKNGTVYHLIQQIEICLNKDFTPRECSDSRTSLRTGTQHTVPQHTGTSLKHSGNSLKFQKHNSGRHAHDKGHYVFQSDCPTHYNFSYPPIYYN